MILSILIFFSSIFLLFLLIFLSLISFLFLLVLLLQHLIFSLSSYRLLAIIPPLLWKMTSPLPLLVFQHAPTMVFLPSVTVTFILTIPRCFVNIFCHNLILRYSILFALLCILLPIQIFLALTMKQLLVLIMPLANYQTT